MELRQQLPEENLALFRVVFDRFDLAFRVHAALETMRRVRVHAEPAGRTGNRQWREERALQENAGGVGLNAAALTTHDPRQRHRPTTVGDKQ